MNSRRLLVPRAAIAAIAIAAALTATLASAQVPASADPAAAPSAPAPAGPAATEPAAPAPADAAPSAELSNKQRFVTPEDLESVKDVLEEKILRGVRSRYLVTFNGFVTAGFAYQEKVPYTVKENVYRDSSSTLRLANAAFSLSGFLRENPVDDGDLRYRVSFFYQGPTTSSRNGQTGNTSSVQVTDGVLLWDLVRQKKKLEPPFQLNLTLGQQLVPFGADNTATEEKLPTINLAQYLGAWRLRRDIGLVADGGLFYRYDPPSGLTTPVIAYQLGVFNGAGANRWDDNRTKDYVAKLYLAPVASFFSVFRGLRFGGSYYWGNGGQPRQPTKERWGAELEYLHKPFLLAAEYLRGEDRAVGAPRKLRSEAVVATLFYQQDALPDFQPLVRFDYLDPDRGLADDGRIVGTVGFNWFFWQVEPVTRRTYEVAKTERVVKLQANWNRIWDEARGNGNQILAQLVASF